MADSHDSSSTTDFKVELTSALEAVPLNNIDSPKNPNRLEDAIQKWLSIEPDTPLLYVLQDSSTPDDISLNGLAPADLTRFCCLRSLESQCHFYVFISQVEKREIGTEIDTMYRAFEEKDESGDEDTSAEVEEGPDIDIIEWAVQLALDVDGNRKLPTLDIKPESILRDDVLSDREPDEEDGLPEGYDEPVHPDISSIDGPQTRTTTYILNNFLQASDIESISYILESFSSRCNNPASDDMHFETLFNLCDHFFSRWKAKKHLGELLESTIAKILEVAVLFRDRDLFELTCSNINGHLSPYFFSVIPVIIPKELRELVPGILDKMVELCYTSTFYEQDGETLVLIACTHRDYGWLLDKLCPLVSKRRDDIAFVLWFSWQLHVSVSQGRLDMSDSFGFVKETLKDLIARFDVTRLISEQGFQRWQQQRVPHRSHIPPSGNATLPPPPPPPVTSNTLLNSCRLLLDLGMEADLRELGTKLIEQSERIDLLEFFDLYVPFVGRFMDLLASRSVSILDPLFSALIRAVIQAFWTRYVVMEEPIPTQNERRQASNGRLVKSCWVKRLEHARHLFATLNQRSLLLVLGRDYYNITGNAPPYSENQQAEVIIIDPPSSTPMQSSTYNTPISQVAPSYSVPKTPVADHCTQTQKFQTYRSQEPQYIFASGTCYSQISSSATPLGAQQTLIQADKLPAAVHPQVPSARASLAAVSEGPPLFATGLKRKQLEDGEFTTSN
ncbi:uncharacterized protein F4812DRAFT_452164 [Daldinia caldariorum]|uniref:uncharacterized protein n=1 Tax=Daldinia caldariorum TaxID=326644 RepID=UPI0020075330|nr:uncharacterized protein F4812DRAFT_452164 [Daldinia caldariorum]KAI1465621.1 hypothetical protein F4812DRAFT_452164 [Daldinia caldariorum]